LKKLIFLTLAIILLFSLSACDRNDSNTGAGINIGDRYITVPGDYTLPNDVALKDVTNFKTLKDGEKVVKVKDNEMHYYKEDAHHKIVSSCAIDYVGNFSETREWEHNCSQPYNNTFTSNKRLGIILGTGICDLDNYVIIGSGLGRRTTYLDCTEYPSQLKNESGRIIDKREFLKLSNNSYLISLDSGYYDPTYRNMTVGLIGCWDLEDETDYLGNHNLQNVGSVPFVTGKVGDGAEFVQDTGDYLNNTDFGNNEITGSSSFSYAVWIESDDTGQDRSILRGDTSNNGWQLWMDGDTGGSIRHDSEHEFGNTLTIESAFGVHTTNWQQIGFAWSANSHSGYPNMYIDGAGTTLTTNDSAYDSGGDSRKLYDNNFFAIGLGLKGAFDGVVDELMVWNIRLNSTDFEALYNSGDGVSCADLQGGTEPTDSCGTCNIDCADDCVETENRACATGMNITGTGSYTTAYDITITGDLLRKGTDASNRCIIKCDGGCFV